MIDDHYSALKKLSDNLKRPDSLYSFKISFPIIEEMLTLDNDQLEKDIREAGHAKFIYTAAECFRTRWDMHMVYPSFMEVADIAVDIASRNSLSKLTTQDGKPDVIPWKVKESWGLIYGKGEHGRVHAHWPATWAYVYCVYACDKCSPLIFDQMIQPEHVPSYGTPVQFKPKTGQMIIFPAWLNHHVEKQECDHDRIKLAGNIDTNFDFDKPWQHDTHMLDKAYVDRKEWTTGLEFS